ncbi:MAG: Ig-like domain-containing protein, partial [Prosthecobacter sp.]|nr:Ig-like domain-containing protein [Prosthecobacter sp.]
ELELTGTPKVAIGGVDAVHFSVTSQPNSPIAAGESSTFAVKFNPSSAGTKSATVTVASSDEDKNPYTFTIQGTGLTPGLVAFTAAKFAVNQGAVQVRLTVERTGGAVPFEVAINTADGTANKTPPFAAATTPSDYVDLAGPKAILSFGEGEMSQDVFVTLAPKSGTQPNKRFIATISAPTNGASLGDITETTIEILANDTTKPTLTVAAPTNGAKISTLSPYLVTGIAGDAKGIDRVEVALNGADALPATLGPATIPTSVPYSLPISPSPGSNTLVVTAYDLRGNSASVTRSFTFMRRYLLTITRGDSAAGTVALVATPSTAASALTPTAASSNPKTSQILPGTTVKLTATPKTGFVFKDWLGLPEDAAVLGNLVTFAMPAADATITAEFIATPFTPPAGQTNTFLGLIHPTGGTPSSNATEGFLTGTLTTAGAFTGKLLIDGVSQPIAAVFFGDGSALFTVGATKQTSLNFGGRILTSSFNTGAITADLTKDTNTSAGTATRPIYSTANKVTTELLNSAAKGFYTLSFPPMEQTPPVDIATYPQGHGFATLNLSNAGAITLTGMLADGVAVTASSALLNGDTAPIFARLSTPGATAIKGGSFSGTVAFDNTQTDSDVTATDLLWFRPAAVGATTPLYTPGWPNGIRVNAFGALYATATKVQATLGLDVTGNAQLFFSAGKLNPGIIKANFKIVANTVIKPSPIDTSFTLTLAPTTGAFSGTFTPNWPTPATAKPAFKGILIQKGANKGGFGYFLSNAKSDPDPESGSVTLSAP